MKNLLALIVCLIICTGTYAQTEKRVHKEYSSSDFNTLKITSSFGDIEVIPHEGSKIEVLIVVTVENKKIQKEFLDNFEFSFVENGRTLVISENKFSIKGNVSFTKKITLKVPENLKIDVTSLFGNVKVNGTSGSLKLHVEHGDCFIAYANGLDNDFMVLFGDVRIESLNKSKIVMQHGDLKINKANDIILDIQFGDINMDILGGKSEFKIAHGDLKINEISNKYTALKIGVEFGDVYILGLSAFSIDMDLSGVFSSYSFGKNLSPYDSTKGINDVHYKVKSGSGADSSKILKITASHSDVSLK